MSHDVLELDPEIRRLVRHAGPRDVVAARRKIYDLCASFDAMHVLACAVAETAFATPDWREAEQDSLLANEHLVSVLLERSSRGPVASPDPSKDVLLASREALRFGRRAVSATMFMTLRAEDESESAIHKLAKHFTLAEAVVMGPGHEDDEKAVLLALFGNPERAAALEEKFGLTIEDVLAFEDAITQIMQRRYRLQRLHDPEELRRSSLVKKLSVTARALSRESGRDAERAERFLELFACGFGHRVQGGALLWGNSDIRRRPLATAGDGRYLCTIPLNLLWSIRPTLEEGLKATAHWEPYQQSRAQVIQQKAADCFAAALRPDRVWPNLSYDIDGVGSGFEVDLLILVDAVLLSVEVKAGDFSAGALRGRPAQVRDKLSGIVGKAADQAQRLRFAIRNGETIRFYEEDSHQEVKIDLRGVRRVEPVVITLRDFAWLQTCIREWTEAGILQNADDLPWIASIYDLLAITPLVEHPSQLTRYVEQRRALAKNVRNPADEVNLFMAYMDSNLESLRRRETLVTGKHTEGLETHRMFDGPKPTMRLPAAVASKLRELEQQRAPGWVLQGERLIARVQRSRPARFVDGAEFARHAVARI